MKSNNFKKAILTMGIPGAGKSHVLSKNYDLSEYTVIDPDAIKQEKKDYSDENPAVYHEWSKKVARFRTEKAIFKGENLAIDGTGTNVEKMVRQIKDLQSQGYTVELLYVKVNLATSIKRNQERTRHVSVEVIMEKFETISVAFEILAGVANSATVINND